MSAGTGVPDTGVPDTGVPDTGVPDTDLPGLPAGPAREWVRRNIPGADVSGPWRPEVIAGGLSNITYRLPLRSGNLILRRPPAGHLLPRAHDVGREYRVLSALAATRVPVPVPLGFCADAGIIGAPFYVMPEVPGAVLRSREDTGALTVEQRSMVASALAETLAALHTVDPLTAGLGDFGRIGGYCQRQLATWGKQWERSRTRDLPDMTRLLAALAERAPREDSATSIVHGDYRIDNVIVGLRPRPRVAAVLDWELSTLGDPLADLGTTMAYWHDDGDAERYKIPVAAGVTARPGFPSAAGFAELYAKASGRDLRDLGFYLALGTTKLAVILEGVHARYLSGQASGTGYATAGPAVPVLVACALRQLSTAR
jgi:aminoglycoside phosphotransferase (APT) family kinase protein